MADANAGGTMYYHDSSGIFMVEILEVKDKAYGKNIGEEYKLRILESVGAATKNLVKSGLEFIVWKPKDAGAYVSGSWYLSNELDKPIIDYEKII